MSGAPFTEILDSALTGDNACAVCGGPVPVASCALELLARLHEAGGLEGMEPEGVRMMLVLGSLEAGCGMAAQDGEGRVRVSCRSCASPRELALARQLTAPPPSAPRERDARPQRRFRVPLQRA